MERGCERGKRRGNEMVVMKGGLVKHVRIVVRGKIMSFSSLNCCSWPWLAQMALDN